MNEARAVAAANNNGGRSARSSAMAAEPEREIEKLRGEAKSDAARPTVAARFSIFF